MKNNFVKIFTDLFLKFFDKIANLILRILGFKGLFVAHRSTLIRFKECRSSGVALRLGV